MTKNIWGALELGQDEVLRALEDDIQFGTVMVKTSIDEQGNVTRKLIRPEEWRLGPEASED